MGWWKIKDVETGQVSKNWDDGRGIANAIPHKDSKNDFYNGDKPADIMGKALREIRKCYQEDWERIEKPEEMKAVFNFCYNPMRDK